MNSVGMVCILIGSIIVLSRAMIVVAPVASLRWFNELIAKEARVRMMGICSLFMPALLIWAGTSEDTTLAGVLLIFGLFFLIVAIPWLVFFPRSYIEFSRSLLPTNLLAWRLLGVLGVIVGLVLVNIGMDAL